MSRGLLLGGERLIPAPSSSSARHASEYAKTAALLRRRALQSHRTDDERAELRRRADWYERRAVVKREGGIMPPELRTPLESLELVDELRRRLASVDLARQLSLDEVEAFCLALKHVCGDRPCAWSSESVEVTGIEPWLDLTIEMLGVLGVDENTESGGFVFLPFVIRTAVNP
jgi:hypothetical protein